MSPFNLVAEPWIRVRYLDGRNILVSLETLFRDAATITDLDCPPHERISLMRLLVCITQAELGAPESPDDWDGFGDEMEARIPAYLKRHDIRPHFNLFGEGPRFLQGEVDGSEKAYPLSQMMFHLSDGNSPTLLDQAGGTSRAFPPDVLARSLLTYQNFFVGGSMASKIKGNGPSLKILHCLLLGKNLRQTILLNCIDGEIMREAFSEVGRPSWESHSNPDSFFGRLVPVPCRIKLGAASVWIEDGMAYNEYPAVRDIASTIVVRADKAKVLRADLERGIWKDLHAIAMIREGKKQEQRAPLVLQSHVTQFREPSVLIWLGELYKAKDAKVEDLLEFLYPLPVELLKSDGRTIYESGAGHAEAQSNQLYRAVKRYGKEMKEESRPPNEAKRHYWTNLEQQVPLLFQIVRDPELRDGKAFGEGSDPWTQAVWKAAVAAYEHACPRQTPRQLQAYSAGWEVLRQQSGVKKITTKKKATA